MRERERERKRETERSKRERGRDGEREIIQHCSRSGASVSHKLIVIFDTIAYLSVVLHIQYIHNTIYKKM